MEADSIVAIATPPGEGGVGIVRISGGISSLIAGELFPLVEGAWTSHRLRLGELIDPGSNAILDEAMGVYMAAPRTYTGEDVFEIHAHGSPLILERIVEICVHRGCRVARPGEFTLRAFLNGRIDLAQAEAVLDVVRAKTNDSLGLALAQLRGWLSDRVEPLRLDLMGTLAHLEAMVDFVEDDIPPSLDARSRSKLQEILGSVRELLSGAEQGIILRDGATLAIVGAPNVGKSSIMNGLLGLERSIVTAIPGTTRDTVEETVHIRGVAFRTVDTAGITESCEEVERLGVERSRQALSHADVLLLVLDRSRPLNSQDWAALEAVKAAPAADGKESRMPRLVVALNKADLEAGLDVGGVVETLGPHAVVESSAVTSDGLTELRRALEGASLGGARHEVIVGNVRHRDALKRAETSLQVALASLDSEIPLDVISLDIRAAAQDLAEITGSNVDEELLDRIFRDFCIGK